MEILTDLPGRLRLRDNALADSRIAESARRLLANLPGVSAVRVNPRTRTLLLLHSGCGASSIDGHSDPCMPAPAESGESTDREASSRSLRRRKRFTVRNVENAGMLASLALNLISALTGWKGLHVASGLLFAGVLTPHVVARRRQLLK